jgi:hypothetical protein
MEMRPGECGLNLMMRIVALATMAGWLCATPCHAELDLLDVAGQPLTISGTMRARWEVWNWFTPGKVANGQDNNRYFFEDMFVRLGAGYQINGVKAFAELMTPALLNLPDNAAAPAPQGALGLGATYYTANNHQYGASVFLKQGYLEFRDKLEQGTYLKGGRFEFADGTDLIPRDPELRWLVKMRIQQRLIGPFDYTDIARSFDGALARYGSPQWNLTAMYGVPTKGAFDLDGMDEIRNMDLVYAALNAGPNRWWGTSVGRIFYIYYDDGRGLTKVDNRPAAVRAADRRPIDIHTAGVDFARTFTLGPGKADVLLWGAGQLGGWGRLTQESWAAVGEVGYRFVKAPWKPWLRAGYTSTSGSGSKGGDVHGTFFQILPTARLYAQFPFYNMMNSNDLSSELVLAPRENIETRTTLHNLWLSSSRDLWYQGGGAYDNDFFGYAGRPSFGRAYLATLLDTGVTWKVNRHLSTYVYYGHAFGGSVASAIYPVSKQADYGYVEATFTF